MARSNLDSRTFRSTGARKTTPPKAKTKKKQTEPIDSTIDPYLEVLREQWPHILKLYEMFEDKRPVMLFDIQEQRVYAFPYLSFKAGLSERSQAMLAKQRRSALASGAMVVFIRDNVNEKLVSYSWGRE